MFVILASMNEKERKIISEENEWAHKEEDKTDPTWSAGAGPREGKKRDGEEEKMYRCQ